MDCGTCDSASIVVVVEKPQIISVNLTITDNASSMLKHAFGEDKDMALLVGVFKH